MKRFFALFLFTIILAVAVSAAEKGITSKADILNVLWLPSNAPWPGALPQAFRQKLLEGKNTQAVLGKNVFTLLDQLEGSFLPLVQRYPDRYQLLKERAAQGLTARQAYNLVDLLGEDYFDGFGSIPGNATLTFPEDHKPHFDFQTGWYFFAGNFNDLQGNSYGILCMFFRRALFPPYLAKRMGLSDLDNQVVDVQFGVTLGDKKLHLQGHNALIAGSSGLVKYNTNPFLAQVGKNIMQSFRKDKLFPMKIHFKDPAIPLEVNLLLKESQPILLQGDQGRAPAIYGLGSLYYSIPGIKAHGFINYQGQEKQVAGVMWMDNQWMAGIMPSGYAKNIFIRALANSINGFSGQAREGWGWDWNEVQFEDGSEVTFSAMHSTYSEILKNRGPNPPGRITRPIAAGKFVDPSGRAVDVSGEVTLTRWVLSPASRAWFPCQWEVAIPTVKLKFSLTPLVNNQLMYFANASEYKEGAVAAHGSRDGKPIKGVGFAESVAYAGYDYYLKTKFAILGINDTPCNRELMMAKAPDFWLTVKSALFLSFFLIIILVIVIWLIMRWFKKRNNSSSVARGV